MFSTGEYIIYGSNGVCQITGICPSPIEKNSEQLYYVIKPLNSNGNSTIFTPVENERVIIRKILSSEEIDELIDSIPDIQTIGIQYVKFRKDSYKQAMQKCDPVEYIKIIKTVYVLRLELKNTKKRLLDSDIEYEQKAKNCLYSEIAFVLNIPFGNVEDYIANKVNENSN
jgi:CarD family transcriptional regulator